MSEVEDDMKSLYAMGCRYYHIHARNPLTGEQSIAPGCSRWIFRSCRC